MPESSHDAEREFYEKWGEFRSDVKHISSDIKEQGEILSDIVTTDARRGQQVLSLEARMARVEAKLEEILELLLQAKRNNDARSSCPDSPSDPMYRRVIRHPATQTGAIGAGIMAVILKWLDS